MMNLSALCFPCNLAVTTTPPIMDILFTPWRYPYLTAPKSESRPCIFCNAVNSDALRETLTALPHATPRW